MAPIRSDRWRDILLVADEYHAFATVGETDPTGDEPAVALSRQARLSPIVTRRRISSLRSVLASDGPSRMLLQCFRTKVFLATSDEFTARVAAVVRTRGPAEATRSQSPAAAQCARRGRSRVAAMFPPL